MSLSRSVQKRSNAAGAVPIDNASYWFTDSGLIELLKAPMLLLPADGSGMSIWDPTKYSQAISVDNTDASAQMQVLSDLNTVKVNYLLTTPAAEQVTLEVCTTNGIVLFEQNESLMAGRNQLSIALTGIRSGKYLLKVLGKTELPEHVESFVKLSNDQTG